MRGGEFPFALRSPGGGAREKLCRRRRAAEQPRTSGRTTTRTRTTTPNTAIGRSLAVTSAGHDDADEVDHGAAVHGVAWRRRSLEVLAQGVVANGRVGARTSLGLGAEWLGRVAGPREAPPGPTPARRRGVAASRLANTRVRNPWIIRYTCPWRRGAAEAETAGRSDGDPWWPG